jgi:hypothetical protein
MEFKAFDKIKHLKDMKMSITQKIHGTNAHVYVFEYTSTNGQSHEPRLGIKAASRNRWLYPEDDNYGFAGWVEKNKEALTESLGLGRHDGEWCGLGINNGEGLEDKTFVLFDWWRYQDKELPEGVRVVPVLYHGPIDLSKVDEVCEDLKENGSKLSKGFMRPEGVVVMVNGQRFKKVFKPEESEWKKGNKNKGMNPKEDIDYSHLCQPIRLEKLLSKDERYMRDYPKTLSSIARDYVSDLVEEGQITGDKGQIKAITKDCTKQIFAFIKEYVDSEQISSTISV